MGKLLARNGCATGLFKTDIIPDRDRPAFYQAIRSVRERGMDITGWLEYFVEGLRPNTNRRTLQRDLKGLMDKGLLAIEGATNRLMYRLKEAKQ